MKQGIYYNLPEVEYHAVDAISSTLIKKFLISPVDAWEYLYNDANEDTADKIYGRAMHKLILEGRKEFENHFAKGYDKTDHPDALNTVKDIVSYMDENGVKAKAKNKTELIAECNHHFPDAKIVDQMRSEHGRQNANKTLLPATDYDEISRLEWINKLLPEDGRSEVSIFWDHPDWGLCKARLDHFVPGDSAVISDLKSFTNRSSKPVERAVETDIAYYNYHIQAAWYTAGVKALTPEVNYIEFNLIFIEKGKVFPNVIPRDITMYGTELGQICKNRIQETCDKIAQCREKFGNEPWNKVHRRELVNVEHLPMWAL